MSQTLCDDCRKINIDTLSAYPAKVWVKKHIVERPPLNPSLLRSAASLSSGCPMCQVLLGCVGTRGATTESPADGTTPAARNLAFLSLLALPSGDYYEQFSDKVEHSGLSIQSLLRMLALWLYRIAWEIWAAERRRKRGKSGLLRFSQITVQVSFEGKRDGPCSIHEDCSGYHVDRSRNIGVFVRSDAPQALRSLVIGPPVRPVNSVMRTGWIQESLALCLSTHQKCQQGLSGRTHNDDEQAVLVPTRLIDVRGKSDDGVPFLCDSKGRRGRYTALSYCWGEPVPGVSITMLTKDTLVPFQSRLPAALPKTIQDAIDVTRDLGFQYLWIDRFCIIQDDADDWRREAKNMCNIYEGASLTVAAMSAVSDKSGLYNDSSFEEVALDCSVGDERPGKMYLAPSYPSGEFNKIPVFDELERCKWNSRGWVMQERLLSRRIVYFGQNQIYWECHEQDDSSVNSLPQKDTDETVRSAWVSYGTKALILKSLSESSKVSTSASNQALGRTWGKIVQSYTNRMLTKQEDKLIAIAGVAEALRTNLPGSEYLYGHWEHLLGMDDGGLFWDPYGTGDIDGSGDQTWNAWSGAPSWSWATYPGRISWPRSINTHPKPGKPLIRAAKFVTNPSASVGGDWYGGNKILQVEGIVLCVHLKSNVPLPTTAERVHMIYTGDLVWNSTPGSNKAPRGSGVYPGHVSIHIDQPYNRPPEHFWILLFSTQQAGAMFYGGTAQSFTSNFLVLGRTGVLSARGNEDTYHRMGWGSYSGKLKDIQQVIKSSAYTTLYLI